MDRRVDRDAANVTKCGEIFGFPVYTSPDLPSGEIALIGSMARSRSA